MIPPSLSLPRRGFMAGTAGSFASLALATMLAADEERGATRDGVLQTLHHPAKAKRVVQLFMAGGASHIDLWDHKPALEKLHGQPSDFGEPVEAFQDGLGPWMKSPFAFRQHGQAGKWLSGRVTRDCWPGSSLTNWRRECSSALPKRST